MKYVLSLIVAVQAFAADPISDALQKGLFEEEANHNLDAAIKAYQSVIDQTAEQRKLTATAVFRLGECYRKLNKTNEAVAQYQRVYREFPDQTNLLMLSQRALAQFGVPNEPLTASQGSFADRLRSIVKTAEPEDPQAKEMARLKTLAKDSPDLLIAKLGDGDTSLHWAAKNGYLQVAEFLLSNKVDVNFPNSKRNTPLHAAVWSGHKPIVELLLTNGADISAFGRYSDHGSAELIEPYSCQPLHLAVYQGNLSMAELLLNYKADVNGKDYRGRTPLHFAVDQGFLGIARFLISKGANVNLADEIGRTPVMVAAAASHDNVFRALMDSGADVNAQTQKGDTLAHYAARERSPAMLKVVLERKPNLEIENKDYETPLMTALRAGYLKNMELLLQTGANPNHTSEKGWFPLYFAVSSRRDKEFVRLLLAYKADPNLTLEGRTALSVAVLHSQNKNFNASDRKVYAEAAEELRKHGAKESASRMSFIGVKLNENLNDQYFRQDPNGWNNYTLYELLHFMYAGYGADEDFRLTPGRHTSFLAFPDFGKVRIERVDREDGELKTVSVVGLAERLAAGDCANDLSLEWGDIVNISSQDRKLNESWTGLSSNVAATLSKCLERQVTITVKGETKQFRLRPAVAKYNRGEFEGARRVWTDGALSVLRIKNVLNESGMLRASSDLRRVRVVRTFPDGEKREIVINAEAQSSAQTSNVLDLLLRDGDVIQVPEKS